MNIAKYGKKTLVLLFSFMALAAQAADPAESYELKPEGISGKDAVVKYIRKLYSDAKAPTADDIKLITSGNWSCRTFSAQDGNDSVTVHGTLMKFTAVGNAWVDSLTQSTYTSYLFAPAWRLGADRFARSFMYVSSGTFSNYEGSARVNGDAVIIEEYNTVAQIDGTNTEGSITEPTLGVTAYTFCRKK